MLVINGHMETIKSEDDEVELLLKFEEICLESGKEFAPMFSKVLEVLYEKEILNEEAILSWASEKQEADESDKVFLKQYPAVAKKPMNKSRTCTRLF